jgi:hypothetical protein
MLKKKVSQVAISGVLLTTAIFSPLSLNTERITSLAFANEKVYEKPIDRLTFLSSNDLNEKVNKVQERKDETLDKMKEKIKTKSLKVSAIKLNGKVDKDKKSLVESTDLAANVEDVRKDSELQAYLQSQLQEGKRVYLYGSLTIKEYKKLLKLNEIKIKVNKKDASQGYLSFGSDLDTKEKGPLKKNAPETEEVTNIIGFTLDNNEPRQFVDISVSSYDDEGSKIENKEEFYIQDIMAEQADLIQMEEKQNPEKTALISLNQVSAADNPIVDQAYGAYSLAKNSFGTTMGRVDMDWELLQEPRSGDGSSTYDYFTLTPLTQANAYNGAQAKVIWQDIDIPSDSDELRQWTPQGDNTKTDWSLSLGFPFNFGVSMNFADDTKIDDQSSTGYDYARWDVTDGNLDDEVFRGAAGWASYGTQAYASYAAQVTVQIYSGTQYKTAAKRLYANYNY